MKRGAWLLPALLGACISRQVVTLPPAVESAPAAAPSETPAAVEPPVPSTPTSRSPARKVQTGQKGGAFPAAPAASRPLPPFHVGEYLEFVMKYGVISAGSATLELQRQEKLDGREVYYILSHARTNAGMDAIFKVRDKSESWWDAETLCAKRFQQDLREGRQKRRLESVFTPGRFVYKKWKNGKESVVEGDTAPCVQDILSSLYYLRMQPLKLGESYTMTTNSGAKTWPLRVHVRGRDRVKVPAGTFVCLRLEPEITGEALFEAKGKIEVWVTDDAQRMPVLLRSKVAVGAFDAELRKFSVGNSTAAR